MEIGQVGGRVRAGAAALLNVYGRAVLTVAEVVAGEQTVQRVLPSRPVRPTAPEVTGRVDAASMDLGDLRRLALDAVLAAAGDPARSARDRFAARTDGLSEWAAGRLVDEAERMRQAAVAIVAAGSGDGLVLQQRQFEPTLRRQFPWVDERSATRLYEHGVLVAQRITPAAVESAEDETSGLGRIGALVGRFRSRN